MDIKIPSEIRHIINTLEDNGHEACVVGGCVRDSLLGKEPDDWDVCTSALPEETGMIFNGHHIIETGLRHGTVTIVLNHKPFEVTTYRVDGRYTDNRRPDKVTFVRDLKEDLSRRDFSINAMAYNPKKGIVDLFDGRKDLSRNIIKCVGDPDKRFREDALRIMRAMRFASVFGFSIDRNTSAAMFSNRQLLRNISAERIANELNKMIVGVGVRNVLTEHAPVVSEIIPELTPTIGFKQNNPYHCHDVFTHTMVGVESAPKDVIIRLAMLLHDIAKPGCYTEENGRGHFYGHPQAGSDMAKGILSRLKYDNNTVNAVTQLILYHDAGVVPRVKHVKRWLNKIGEERLRQLLEVKKADATAQSELHKQEKLDCLKDVFVIVNEIIELQQCFSLKDLAVNGRDLMAIGVPEGVKIGIVLNSLVDAVIDEKAANDKDELMKIARKMIEGNL